MSLGVMDAAPTDRFDRLCRLVSVRTKGGGITLGQLGECAALAQELESTEADSGRLEELSIRLGLELEEVLA